MRQNTTCQTEPVRPNLGSYCRDQLESIVATLQRRWGTRALHRARDAPATAFPACPSSFPELDAALGLGGFPRGRFSELIGYGTAGQFTVAASALAQAQLAGDQVAYVDTGAAVDVDSLRRCGVRLEALVILRPRDFTHALTMTGDLLRAGGVGALAFDRLQDLRGLAVGQGLSDLDRALRDWTPTLSQSLCAFLFLTESPSPKLYPPGLPLPYFATLRLEFSRQRWLCRRRQIVGYLSQVSVLKNKLGPAGQSVSLRIPLPESG
jgi:recombination protein RecA